MPVDHKEIAFEAAIEESLLTHGGYLKGDPEAFDRELALDRAELLRLPARLPAQDVGQARGPAWCADRVHRPRQPARRPRGPRLARRPAPRLQVLRQAARLAYFAPAHGMNPATQALYESNRLTVTRQLKYSLSNENSIDLVIGLNGLPVVTAELKNPMSGQTWRDAVWQYKTDRDPAETIFRFKLRSLVHFAVDPDEVYMTTKLAGKATSFLPFNKGDGTAAGNPPNPAGYKTAYLWEQVLARDSLMDILARFLHLEVDERKLGGKTVRRETMIFPRYHQLDCVRKAEADARTQGVGLQLPDPALGRQRQEQLDRLACPPPRQPAHLRRPQGLRQRRRGHRPPRARQAAPGHDLPVRAQAGRRLQDRRELKPARRGPGSRHGDRRHHDAEVPLRHREDRRAAQAPLRRDRR